MEKLPSLIFMGTPDFARVSLQHLLDDGFPVKAVVTQPDRPQGRHNLLIPPPVKTLALEYDIPLLQPESLPNITEQLKRLAPDFIVVVAYGQILDRDTLGLPCMACQDGTHQACINAHASLLPKYRGASPIQAAIFNGDKISGVSTMLMEKGMDTGPVLLRETVPIDETDTFATLHDKLATAGAALLSHTLLTFQEIRPEPQDHTKATYTEKITKQHGAIDWNKPARDIHNQVRACTPWPTAYTLHKGKRLIFWKTRPMDCDTRGRAPGTVLEINKDLGIIVAAARSCLAVQELQRQGKKRMPFDSFLRGNKVDPEDTFDVNNPDTK